MQIALDDDGSFMLVEDELDRVMPSRRSVMGAGRYDLHHAIQYHGGYTQVPPGLLHLAKALPICATVLAYAPACISEASASPLAFVPNAWEGERDLSHAYQAVKLELHFTYIHATASPKCSQERLSSAKLYTMPYRTTVAFRYSAPNLVLQNCHSSLVSSSLP